MEVLRVNLEKLPPAFTHTEGCVIKASQSEISRVDGRRRKVAEVLDCGVIMQQHPENPLLLKPKEKIPKILQAEAAASEEANLLHADKANHFMRVDLSRPAPAAAYQTATAKELLERRKRVFEES